MELKAKAFKYGDDINTDYIISGKYKFKSADMEAMAVHAMEELDPDYYDKVKPEGGFLVAGKNFGMGSSREQAPLVLIHTNTKAVLAKSFARIFYRNAINTGLPVIECDTDLIDDGDELVVDLESGVLQERDQGHRDPVPAAAAGHGAAARRRRAGRALQEARRDSTSGSGSSTQSRRPSPVGGGLYHFHRSSSARRCRASARAAGPCDVPARCRAFTGGWEGTLQERRGFERSAETDSQPEETIIMADPKKLTTNAGRRFPTTRTSMTAGPRGPMLLQDVWFLEKLAHFDREVIPERRMHAKGSGRLRHLHGHPRHHPLHQGQDLLGGRQEDRPLRPLLHGRRRARRGRRRARHPRLRRQVLHRGRQLGPGGQQHAGLLPARSAEVPRPQPRGEARPAHQPAQRPQQLGLLDLAARGAAPGHHRHERPRHPGELPPHARVRQPHLQLHQRRRTSGTGSSSTGSASRASRT